MQGLRFRYGILGLFVIGLTASSHAIRFAPPSTFTLATPKLTVLTHANLEETAYESSSDTGSLHLAWHLNGSTLNKSSHKKRVRRGVKRKRKTRKITFDVQGTA